ncbi:Palladin [Larimichthys crocea]|uniref:Uncharacterized protein n=1 Tax=Larimichthys crocea TaxID=215358 RepID=A0ACD3RL80_LARCR|nr:Palladin [Larimichthys crocea]
MRLIVAWTWPGSPLVTHLSLKIQAHLILHPRSRLSNMSHSHPMPPQTTENLITSPNQQHQTKAPCPADNAALEVSSSQNAPLSKPIQVSSDAPSSTEKVVRHKPIQPVYKQDKPRLLHEGLELNDRAASATEFCSRAATFIEELSSIFKGSAHLEQQVEEDSSSPDSGYLSPRSRRPVPQGSVSAPSLPPSQQEETQLQPAGHEPGVAVWRARGSGGFC